MDRIFNEFVQNPMKFSSENALFIDMGVNGECSVRTMKYENNVYGVLPDNNLTKIYYIPVSQSELLSCDVPFGAPENTIVMTVGLNGCGFYVKREASVFRFYHDMNNRFLGSQPENMFCCKLTAPDYIGLQDIGLDLCNKYKLKYPKENYTAYYFHSLVAIKKEQWYVYNMGVFATQTLGEKRKYSFFEPNAGNLLFAFK